MKNILKILAPTCGLSRNTLVGRLPRNYDTNELDVR